MLAVAVCACVHICAAQQIGGMPPTYSDVPYGPHERNVLDFWQADTDAPAPLAVYIHGGGFTKGSKRVKRDILKELLDAGISVAAIHYRFITTAPLPAAHHDATRALQFLRSKSDEWNIDKTRVGAFGSSAGAQLCMYLAFNDEAADPHNPDPVLRESSRLTCVAPMNGQTTFDFDMWMKWIPGYDKPHRDPTEYFGGTTRTTYLEKTPSVSALSLISADDPPIFMTYRMAPDDPVPNDPKKARGWKIHHVIFGVKLKEKAERLGVELDLMYPGADTAYDSVPHFLTEKLTEPDDEKGFSSLFNGKDLTGWVGVSEKYAVENGAIVCLGKGGKAKNLFTKDEFGDFVLRFEFKLTSGANNGLGIRAPLDGNAAYLGMELQILDDTAEKYRNLKPWQYHGSIYGVAPSATGHLKPVGEWNVQEVVARGSKITVRLNGTPIVNADIKKLSTDGTIDGRDHPGLDRKKGHIGFLGHGSRIEIRKLRIKSLD